ncbi:MAG: hypothetical protein CMJ78_11440 [Planctomycetaceae bacterium]|nr:hypothetical protein [Planctomycetaceae bacterium]
MLAKRLQGPGNFPDEARVPKGLQVIVQKCLQPIQSRESDVASQSTRYTSVGEVLDDLRRFTKRRPPKFAPDVNWLHRVIRWLLRHPTFFAGMILLIAILTSTVAWEFIAHRRSVQTAKSSIDAIERTYVSLGSEPDGKVIRESITAVSTIRTRLLFQWSFATEKQAVLRYRLASVIHNHSTSPANLFAATKQYAVTEEYWRGHQGPRAAVLRGDRANCHLKLAKFLSQSAVNSRERYHKCQRQQHEDDCLRYYHASSTNLTDADSAIETARRLGASEIDVERARNMLSQLREALGEPTR